MKRELELGMIMREEGISDGIVCAVNCVRTDFETLEGKRTYNQANSSLCHVRASVEIGIFTVHDMQTDTSITISLEDAVAIMSAALTAGREKENEDSKEESRETIIGLAPAHTVASQ